MPWPCAARCLILDDAEGVIEPLIDLIPGWLAAGCRIVVTTRRRLQLVPEALVELGPLAPADAAALFEREALRHNPRRTLDPAEVMALVKRLDGIPLALELAAARSRIYAPLELIEALADAATDPLQDPRRGDRHGSLKAALADAIRDLPDAAARALVRCSHFAQGFSRAAFEAVAGPASLLEELMDHGLVVARGPQRFSVLRPVHDLFPRDPAALDAVGAWIVAEAEARTAQLYGPDRRDVFAWLAAERSNLHIALARGGALGARAAICLGALELELGPLPDPEARLEQLQPVADLDPILRARLLHQIAEQLATQDRPEEALPLVRRAIPLADGDPALRVRCGATLGQMLRYLDEVDEAIEVLQRSLAEAKAHGDPIGEGHCHMYLGVIHTEGGVSIRGRRRGAVSGGRAPRHERRQGPGVPRTGSGRSWIFGGSAPAHPAARPAHLHLPAQPDVARGTAGRDPGGPGAATGQRCGLRAGHRAGPTHRRRHLRRHLPTPARPAAPRGGADRRRGGSDRGGSLVAVAPTEHPAPVLRGAATPRPRGVHRGPAPVRRGRAAHR